MLGRRVSAKIPSSMLGVMGQQRRHSATVTKAASGAGSACISCAAVLSVCHLIVTPVGSSVALATMAAAGLSGAACVVEGSKDDSGGGFGAITGLFVGGMGAWYSKSVSQPWR